MAIRTETQEIVRASPREAFALIGDFSRTPEWKSTCGKLEKVGDGPNARGDRLRFATREALGNKAHVGSYLGRIVEHVPGERLALMIENRGMKSTWDYRLVPVPSGTCIRLTIELEPKNWLVRFGNMLIGRAVRQAIDRMAAEDLKSLAKRLEGKSGV